MTKHPQLLLDAKDLLARSNVRFHNFRMVLLRFDLGSLWLPIWKLAC